MEPFTPKLKITFLTLSGFKIVRKQAKVMVCCCYMKWEKGNIAKVEINLFVEHWQIGIGAICCIIEFTCIYHGVLEETTGTGSNKIFTVGSVSRYLKI